MKQHRDGNPVVVTWLITFMLLLIGTTVAVTVTVVVALIPTFLSPSQIDAVCPVTCIRSCTRLCLRNFVQCNPQSRQITIVTTTDRVPFISQIGTNPPTGFDVDLMNYIADLIGVKFTYIYKSFPQLLSTVQNDINTISISVQTDTVAREQYVNFAQFFQTGTGFMVRSDSTLTINSLADLCGKTVVVLTGSIQVTDVQTQNTLCATANQITITTVATVIEAKNAIQAGTAQVLVDDNSLLSYYAGLPNSQLKVVGQPYNVAPYGILCNKQNSALCCALVNAINYLIQRGAYQALFPKYSFTYTQNGICPSRLNLNGTTCAVACVPSSSICSS